MPFIGSLMQLEQVYLHSIVKYLLPNNVALFSASNNIQNPRIRRQNSFYNARGKKTLKPVPKNIMVHNVNYMSIDSKN